jgi:uncharacterized heparinase superfamily protein
MRTYTNTLLLYLRTIAHLRIRQIAFRGLNLLRKRLEKPGRFPIPKDLRWAPLRSFVSYASYEWLNPPSIAAGTFRFLNETIHCASPIDWHPVNAGRLWKYNLHYFNYLHCPGGLDPGVGIGLIEDWIRQNPPGTPDSWDPFPTSLRLVNWIKYLSVVSGDGKFFGWIIDSMYVQASWLEHLVEYHLLGNHLFKNAKALFFSGMFFGGQDARRWLSKGLRILGEQIDEQILSDGGHFERSPMYHSMILEDCLDLLNICNTHPNPEVQHLSLRLRRSIPAMMDFLRGMSHPDGQIALFNDAAFGIEPTPDQLGNYYARLFAGQSPSQSDSIRSYPESGYFVMTPREGDRLFIDCGRIGPDYQPGHAHSDTLSVELSIKGRRVLVDSGCRQYEDGQIRRYNRGNLGHNTITIDDENQSEVWGAHRCGRRARPLYSRLNRSGDGTLVFEGAHDGYRRLPGGPVHHRKIVWSGDVCTIEDRMEGSGSHKIESRLHIHPDLSVNPSDKGVAIHHREELLAHISPIGEGRIERGDGFYCPEFGLKMACEVLRVILPKISLPCVTGWVIRMA